jgi:hypothetical protein
MGRLLRQARLLGVTAFCALGLMVVGVQPAAAATLVVDDDLVQCPTATFTTIRAAIAAASNGDTIQVCAGTYPEMPGPLDINKSITLLGAQAGTDARTRGGAESIITDPQGTIVSASGVVIDGFTVQDSAVTAFTGYGIWLQPGVSGTQIVNNIIQNNIAGVGLANNGAQALIRHNLIRNNNVPGPATGAGIYTDEFVGGPVVKNVLIEENAFRGNDDAGIDVSNTDPAGGAFSLDISTNSFDMNGRGTVLFNTHNSTIHDNSITNSTLVGSAAIRLFDNNSNLSILSNNLINGTGHAIRLSVLGAVGGPSSGVVIHENNIEIFALDGLLVDPGSHVGTVNAECNWWNSPSGPFNAPNNLTGTGEEVVGDADFTPWLIAPAPSGPCVGGIPSTSGKVTGGGQIQGDPVFSPVGDLLSVPALVASPNSNSRASFGFVVKCCPATGNLEYNDHQADVRIKAKSVDTLFISNGPCGSNTHAKFTGTAAVIRSTGTTTEPFTVDVDDCGEPGTMDTFGIKTTTYSNGPSTLIGGNIQIHK